MEIVVFRGGLDVEVSRYTVDHDVPADHAAGPLVIVHSALRHAPLADLPRIPRGLGSDFIFLRARVTSRKRNKERDQRCKTQPNKKHKTQPKTKRSQKRKNCRTRIAISEIRHNHKTQNESKAKSKAVSEYDRFW